MNLLLRFCRLDECCICDFSSSHKVSGDNYFSEVCTGNRPRCRWEDNIKMDLQEVGGGGGDWMEWLRIGTGGGHL